MTLTQRRKLAALGTTKIVDGVTFTAIPYEGQSPEKWIVWDGGVHGRQIAERAACSARGQNGFTGEWTDIQLPRFRLGNASGETFPPLARQSIQCARIAYEEAKAIVEAFEAGPA